MHFKRFFNDININENDKIYLVLLLIFGISLTYVMISFHQTRGAFNSDIFVYLAGALDVANLNYNHISNPIWINNSPLIIFLTSLVFRLGWVHFDAMLVVTGFFSILGIFGMYTFLKTRFSPLLSFTGAILYNSFSLTLFYFANAMLDVPAVSMILWTLIFTVAATDKNNKYYILVAISFVLTFFTRFTSAYIIILIALYFLKNHDVINLLECLFHDKLRFKQKVISFFKSYEFKCIFASVILGIIIFSIVYLLLFFNYGEVRYFSMAQGSFQRFSNPKDANFITDRYFFVKNFFSLLFADSISFNPIEQFNGPAILSYLISFIGISGVLLKVIGIIKNRKLFKSYSKPVEFRTHASKLILGISCVFLLCIGIFGFKFNYLVTLICFWLIFIILMSLIREYPVNVDNSTLYIMSFALFVFYFVIVSFIDLKCVRYILPAFPGVVYLIIFSLDYLLNFINYGFDYEKLMIFELKKDKLDYNSYLKRDSKRIITRAIPIILIVMCLFFAFNFTNTVDHNEDFLDRVEFCEFIKEYDPDYQSKEFLCMWDLRYFEWYLNKDIIKFGEDVTEFEPGRYDYVITYNKTCYYDNYKPVYREGNYYLNEKIA